MCAATPGRDFNFTVGTKLHFSDVGTLRSLSRDRVVIPIINDEIAEPRESFICTLQGGIVDSVQAVFPSQATIEIRDNDGEYMVVLQHNEFLIDSCFYCCFPLELCVRWAQDFYTYQESELSATVELVTSSDFEVDQVVISGRPERIPDSDPSTLPSLDVPGPAAIPGN